GLPGHGVAGDRGAVAAADEDAESHAGADAGHARHADRLVALVDRAVAVVVDAVAADLDRAGRARGRVADYAELGRGADVLAGALAGADADGAVHAQRREGLIYLAVAVVVEPVAQLGGARDPGLGVADGAGAVGGADQLADGGAGAGAGGARHTLVG